MLSYNKSKQIKYTIARKYDEKPDTRTPGPGTYTLKGCVNENIAMSFAKAERDNALIIKDQIKTPGPGVYA